MNALVPSVLHGEVLPPTATVRAIGLVSPFGGERIDVALPAGLSIAEILGFALADHPDFVLRRDFVVHIDGHVVPERLWSRVRIKAGVTLTFSLRLQGDGWRTALSLVVAIAAFVFAGPLGGALAGAIGITSAIGISVATSLVGAGIILAGTLAINALFPVRQADQVSNAVPGSINSIQGARNQADPFGPVPFVLGRHRQSPRIVLPAFTEVAGNDQYIRFGVCWGYGPIDVSDMRIGDTPLSSFAEVETEHRVGYASDGAIILYPGPIDEQVLQVELKSVDGWSQRTTSDDTDEIAVDIAAPKGMYYIDEASGKIGPYGVLVSAQYSPEGVNDWRGIGTFNVTASVDPVRMTMRIPVPRGKYDVRLQKASADANNERFFDQIVWTALRSFRRVPPITFPHPLCITVVRIRATGQLSGVVDTLNGQCQSLVLAFDGATWNPNTASQWPSDLFRHVLQGPMNARPVGDDQIDLGNLQAWWVYCVNNGFKFNQVVTSVGSIWDKLSDIAAAGRAVPTFIDGKFGVIWDRPNDTIVQHFTPRNSWGFQLQRTYAQQPHGWRVNFINEDNGYTSDERIVYDDGYDSSNATLFEGMQFPGVTDPALIWKHGRFHIAQSRLRPEKVALNVGWEHLVCNRGDRVAVTHDVMLSGLASGRVKSVVGQTVAIDETVTIESGKTYGISFRLPGDQRIIVRAVDPDTATGEQRTLEVFGDLSGVPSSALFAFGETGQEYAVYRVQGIKHQKDLIATLTLVDDAPAISQADQGAIPAYSPNVSIPPDPLTLAPQDFRYKEAVEGEGNAVRATIRLSWLATRRGKIASSELEVMRTGGDWRRIAVLPYPQLAYEWILEAADVWSFRVRFVFDDGTVSKWTVLNNLTLLGLTAPPQDVQNIRGAVYVDSNGSISWDEVVDYRPIRYAVRKGDSWDAGLELGTLAHPPYQVHGNGTYWVKAYAGPDQSRAYSVNAAVVDIEGAALVRNVLAVRDEKADGWNGVFTGTVAKSGTLIRTGGSSDFLSLADFLAEQDVLNAGGQGNGTYEIHPSRYVDAGRDVPCRVTISLKGTSQIATDDFLGNPDILNNPDFLAAGNSDKVRVYPQVSVAHNDVIGDVFSLDPGENPSNDIFAEPDVFSADVSFGPWLDYEPGQYVGRYFRARVVLETLDPQVVAIAQEFVMTVDVPDRLDNWGIIGGLAQTLGGITVPAAGLAIIFASNGKTIAEPFNGGPNADAVPAIQITNTSGTNYTFEVTGLTKNGCTIIPRLAGTPTDAPKTNITIQGW